MARKAGKTPKKQKPPPWSLERAMAELGPRPHGAAERVAWQRTRDTIMARERDEQDLKRRQRRNAVAKKMPEEYRAVAGVQEEHSPTVEFVVRGDIRVSPSGEVKREMLGQTRRRRAAAIIVGLLDPQQQQAFEEIEVAAELIPGIGRIRGQTFERQSRTTAGGPEAEAMVKLQLAYFDWARDVVALGISHAAAVDIIVRGSTLEEVDRGRSKRNGWSKRHLIAAIDMWTITRGWRRAFTPAIQAFADRVRIARTVWEATRMEDDEMELDGGPVRPPGADGGRTLEMVKALPADRGSVVVVFLRSHVAFVEDMVAGIRGRKVRAATRVIAVPERAAAEPLAALKVATFVDPSYWTLAPVPLAYHVARQVTAINVATGNAAQAGALVHAIRIGQWDEVAAKVRTIFAECTRGGRLDEDRMADVVRVRDLPLEVEAGAGAERILMRQICRAVIPPTWRYGFAETLSGLPQPVLLEGDAP